MFLAQEGIPIPELHQSQASPTWPRQRTPSHVLGTVCCSPAHFSLDLAKHSSAGLNSSQSLAEISSFDESRPKPAELLAVTKTVNYLSYLREREGCFSILGVGSSYQAAIVLLESKHPHVASHRDTCDPCSSSWHAHTFMGCFSSFQTTPG